MVCALMPAEHASIKVVVMVASTTMSSGMRTMPVLIRISMMLLLPQYSAASRPIVYIQPLPVV